MSEVTRGRSELEVDRLLPLIRDVEAAAPLASSRAHGSRHWRLVALTGAELVKTAAEADALVVFLFALFHDSQRLSEYVDPDHGLRGGELALELVPKHLHLESGRLELLWQACERHTREGPTDHPTIGICFDSDRLNLWRFDIEPSPLYLSTEEAKRPQRIQWADRLQDQDPSWKDVLETWTEDHRRGRR